MIYYSTLYSKYILKIKIKYLKFLNKNKKLIIYTFYIDHFLYLEK